MGLKTDNGLWLHFSGLLRTHSSLLVVAGGAFAYFLANIYAKKYLEPEDFKIWIYTVSLVSFFAAFAMMGQDQLILRFSKVEKNCLIIDRTTILLALFSLCLFIVFASNLFGGNSMGVGGLDIALLALLYGFCKLGYQLTRLQKRFLLSQLSLNGWKLLVACFIALGSVLGVVNIFLLSFAFGAGVFVSLTLRSRVRRLQSASSTASYGAAYLLSMAVMAAFVYFERFVIEGRISDEDYASYLYFLTLAMSVFSILASYVGFKEAVKYKESCTYLQIKSDLAKVLRFVLPLSFLWGLLINFSSSQLELNFNTESLILVLVIGVLKCVYSILSSVMAVRMPFKEIIYINIATLLFFGVIYFGAQLFAINVSVLLLGVAGAWAIRSALIFARIRRIDGFA